MHRECYLTKYGLVIADVECFSHHDPFKYVSVLSTVRPNAMKTTLPFLSSRRATVMIKHPQKLPSGHLSSARGTSFTVAIFFHKEFLGYDFFSPMPAPCVENNQIQQHCLWDLSFSDVVRVHSQCRQFHQEFTKLGVFCRMLIHVLKTCGINLSESVVDFVDFLDRQVLQFRDCQFIREDPKFNKSLSILLRHVYLLVLLEVFVKCR